MRPTTAACFPATFLGFGNSGHQLLKFWRWNSVPVSLDIGLQMIKPSDDSLMNLTFSMGDRSGLQALIVSSLMLLTSWTPLHPHTIRAWHKNMEGWAQVHDNP